MFYLNNKKKWFSCIILIIVIISVYMVPRMRVVSAETVIWDGTTAENFEGGDGTQSSPYQIANASQLALLSKKVNENDTNYKSANYILTTDIYLNDVSDWKNWIKEKPKNIWQPIGISNDFTGTFNGNGYVIKGMYISGIISKDDEDIYDGEFNSAGIGLFGYVRNATILDLGVEDSCLIDRNYGQGGIVGYLRGGILERCYFDGIIRATEGGYTGGVVGKNNGTIKGCYNLGSVSLLKTQSFAGSIGGIAGNNEGTIENCYNKGTITLYDKSGGDVVGGISGDNSGMILKSYNMGTVKTLGVSECGGIVGSCFTGNIKDSYNKGKIISGKKSENVGGLAGSLNSSGIQDCYNAGEITVGKESFYIGGIAGSFNNSKMSNCYNKGNIEVSGEGFDVGGLIGRSFFYNKKNIINNSYNIGKVSCKKRSYRIGGVAGSFDGSIQNCMNEGTIEVGSESDSIGGIVGETTKTKVYNSYNTGKLIADNSSCIGGIIGNMGAFAIIDDEYPNVKSGIYNCYNKGTIGGKGCFYVGGIVGESYSKSYNCYNVGIVQGSSGIGGIIGRETLGDNNPQNCYYLKGCTKVYNSEYKEEPNSKGIVQTNKQMKSNNFKNKLNTWARKDKKKYSTWKYSSKKNGGYPYLQ